MPGPRIEPRTMACQADVLTISTTAPLLLHYRAYQQYVVMCIPVLFNSSAVCVAVIDWQ